MRLIQHFVMFRSIFFLLMIAGTTSNAAGKDNLTFSQIHAIKAFAAHEGTWHGTVKQFSADGTPLSTFQASYAIEIDGLDYSQTNTYFFDSGTRVYEYKAKIQEDGTLVFSQENFSALYKATEGKWFISGSGFSQNSKNERFVETVVLRRDTGAKERTRIGQFYSEGELASYFVLNETLLVD